MIRRLLVLAAAVLAAGATASVASADGDFSQRLLYDCGPLGTPLCAADRDMAGFDVGWVTSNQRRNGDLVVSVRVRGGDPGTEYSVVLWCGPTHDNAMSSVVGSGVTTDSNGRANLTFVATAAQLGSACGSGSHTSHVDLDSELPSTLTATGIAWSLP